MVDTEDHRRGRLLYVRHYLRIAVAIGGRRPAVIHFRGTHLAARRAIAAVAAVRGRSAHLVMLDAGRDEAEAGQRARGRTVPRAEMDRQLARWRRLVARRPRREGWVTVVVLTREQAAHAQPFAFVPAERRRMRALAAARM